MAIVISNPDTAPELNYDHVFLEKLTLSQRNESDNTATPYYTLDITYRLYAVDENNVRYFRNKVNSIHIDDYATVAMAKAMSGDPDLVNASVAIQAALAKILEDQIPELGSATVTN